MRYIAEELLDQLYELEGDGQAFQLRSNIVDSFLDWEKAARNKDFHPTLRLIRDVVNLPQEEFSAFAIKFCAGLFAYMLNDEDEEKL